MIKGEDIEKTSEITLGTAYEINKNLVQNYEKELTSEELKEIEDGKNEAYENMTNAFKNIKAKIKLKEDKNEEDNKQK